MPVSPLPKTIGYLCVGKSLVGDGNEVAHIDLLMGPRGSVAEPAFVNCLTNQKDGFTSLLAIVAPNLMVKPPTVIFNKVSIKSARQAVQMFGPAQHAVAKAVADSVAEGVIPLNEADDLFICVGVFIHWEASDDKKIQDYNYRATKEAIARAVSGEPTPAEVVQEEGPSEAPICGMNAQNGTAASLRLGRPKRRTTPASSRKTTMGWLLLTSISRMSQEGG